MQNRSFTNSMIKGLLRSLALVLIPTSSAMAQAPASKWDALKMLAPGTQVRVASSTSPKPIQGTLDIVTDSDLVLRRGAGPESLPRPQIISVSVHEKGRRLRNIFLGLGVGTAAGLSIGAGIGALEASACHKSGGGWCGLDTAAGAVLGGASGVVAGSLIGALWHTGKWNKIYVQQP
jgi:hypothetical protein